MAKREVSPDKSITIVDGGLDDTEHDRLKAKLSSVRSKGWKRKKAMLPVLLFGRKRSAEKHRLFQTTLKGLKTDTEYVIKISFVLSGRKLGSESYRILCNDEPYRKSSMESSSTSSSTPKSSIVSEPYNKAT